MTRPLGRRGTRHIWVRGSSEKKSPGTRPGLKIKVSQITGIDYLHSVGAYLASSVLVAAASMPRAAAVCLVNEVHAQSILPCWPAARARPATNGLITIVWPPICGMLAPLYVVVMTPRLEMTMLVTYLVGA